MDYTTQALSANWTWRYRVFQYHIHDPAPPRFQEYGWATGPGGILLADDQHVTREYDPMECADELLSAATSFDPQDGPALERFVNRWGLLGKINMRDPHGVAGRMHSRSEFPTDGIAIDRVVDSVLDVRTYLRDAQELARSLEALKKRRWSQACDFSDDWKEKMGWNRLRPSERSLLCWHQFANQLNYSLNTRDVSVYPVLVTTPQSDEPARQMFVPRCLGDVLLFSLWQNATRDDLVPRRCSNCGGLFFCSKTNAKRKYCSPSCKNNACVNRWRRKKARDKRRKAK